MNKEQENSDTNRSDTFTVRIRPLLLAGLGMVSVAVSLLVISFFFEKEDPALGRPHILVQVLLASTFVWYIAGSIYSGFFQGGFFRRPLDGGRVKNPRFWSGALWLILGVGLACRVLLVFSMPIQELDLYRYIWDGATTSEGYSPYTYPPADIAAQRQDERGYKVPWKQGEQNLRYVRTDDEGIEQLQARLRADEGLAECFGQVHFGQYSSPYPPISQQIFVNAYRLSRSTSESTGTYYAHLVGMKSVIVLFDFLTAIVIVFMLAHLSLPRVWVVAYWWCPLVIKEFSNSGHLDSFAVFFCILAVFGAMRAIVPRTIYDLTDNDEEDAAQTGNFWTGNFWAGFSAVALALGVGAKVFPLFIFPVWFVALFRTSILRALVAAIVFFAVTAGVMWPMIRHTELGRTIAEKTNDSFLSKMGVKLEAPEKTERDSGIEVFSKHWEMNDLAFMVVLENLKVRKPYGFKDVNQIGVIGLSGRELNLLTSFEGTDVQLKVGLPADTSDLQGYAREIGFTEENGNLGDFLEVIRNSDVVFLATDSVLTNNFQKVVDALQPGSTLILSSEYMLRNFLIARVDFPPEVTVISTTEDNRLTAVQDPAEKANEQIDAWSYAVGYHKIPWFVFTGDESRKKIRDQFFAKEESQISEEIVAAKETGDWDERRNLEYKMVNERRRVPFRIARIVTLAFFCLLVGYLCIRMFFVKERHALAGLFGDGVFLTLAWFWMLSPTQNPWYWTWAMGALVLVRNRWWFAISGLSLLYYLRFYFDTDWRGIDVLETGTFGVDFFYFYIPWIEFGPWMLVLLGSWVYILLGKRNRSEEGSLQSE